MKKIAIYARCSTSSQDTSHQIQIPRGTAAKYDWIVVAEWGFVQWLRSFKWGLEQSIQQSTIIMWPLNINNSIVCKVRYIPPIA
jgi:hypothetical protein